MNDIKEFREFVHSLAQNSDSRTFLNSDEDHALEVLVELINKSEHDIRIFAGCLCKHIGNRKEYIIALSDFIERGGNLYILLNQYDEEAAKNADLYRRLAYYIGEGKPIQIKKTTAKPYRSTDINKEPVHFTIGDNNAYRIETDIEKRTAECNFNNSDIAQTLIEFFDELFGRDDAYEIDITNLFH